MDQDTVIQQFDQLEKKIEHLIETCKRLEAANVALEDKRQELAAQLEQKIAVERQHDELKGLVRSKIDGLMVRLDEFTEEE